MVGSSVSGLAAGPKKQTKTATSVTVTSSQIGRNLRLFSPTITLIAAVKHWVAEKVDGSLQPRKRSPTFKEAAGKKAGPGGGGV